MAGLDYLTSLIYHERQARGSMLCAQHALNVLLQGPYFTAPDLSEIGRTLDNLERHFDNNSTQNSTNMDDTGFFSVQVLEKALSVWGLNLTRWRGEEMRPYHDHPHTQLAFILNLEEHWITFRRFGHAEAILEHDTGNGHWFNLNSSAAGPQWVGKLFLGMLLQQAEDQGYSVFAVTQADLTAPLALPRTEADEVAAATPEPSSAPRPHFVGGFAESQSKAFNAADDDEPEHNAIDGVDDEDYELQAALHASMDYGSNAGSSSQTPIPVPSLTSSRPNPQPAEIDPLTASMERSRALLQRLTEHQEFAQRELWEEDGDRERRETRRRQEQEEEDMLKRAIEESEAFATENPPKTLADNTNGSPSRSTGTMNNDYVRRFNEEHIVYDDDDAELQAALRASLEHMPVDWQPPPPKPVLAPVPSHFVPPRSQPTAAPPGGPKVDADDGWTDDTDSVMTDDTEHAEPAPPGPEPALSVEEIRRRRLARFGG